MASRIPELLHEIRTRSRKQGVEYVEMNDYLDAMKLPVIDMSRVLRSVLEKQWVAAIPEYTDLARVNWNYKMFPGMKLALLPDGLIFLEQREREHEMMADTRAAKNGATLSWVIAAVAAVISAFTWLFPRGGTDPKVTVVPVVYKQLETDSAAHDSIRKPTVPASAPAIGDSAKQDSVPDSVPRR